MNHKWSLLGVRRFYTREEALRLLMNMSDFEDESTSESEIEGDSSDSSEYAPEQQYQVRTNSNIQTLLPKEMVNQNATKCALLASPPKVSKAKEIPKKSQKAAPKLVVNQNATKHALLLYNILPINWYTGNITTKCHSESMGDNTYSCLVLHQKISSLPVSITSDTRCF